MNTFNCNKCNKEFETIGIPPQIQMLQGYKNVMNIGGEVPQEIKDDPFLYRGFYCPTCNEAFCPSCCGNQGQLCPKCGQTSLMPAYRPLLNKIKKEDSITSISTKYNPEHYHRVVEVIYKQKNLLESITKEGRVNLSDNEKAFSKFWHEEFTEQEYGIGLNLEGAVFDRAIFCGCGRLFENANFKNASLNNTTWYMITLSGCDFTGASIKNSTITPLMGDNKTIFKNANLTGLQIIGSLGASKMDFSDAIMDGCTLMGGIELGKGCSVDDLLNKLSIEQRSKIINNATNKKEATTTNNGKNCFIATAIYGDPYHQSVCILREYRDNTLSKYLLGRMFIRIYYIISPHLIVFIKSNQWIEKSTRKLLDKIVDKNSKK